MAKYKIGDIIRFNSFGEVRTMVVANVIDPNSANPMYEDEDGSAVFENDLISD